MILLDTRPQGTGRGDSVACTCRPDPTNDPEHDCPIHPPF